VRKAPFFLGLTALILIGLALLQPVLSPQQPTAAALASQDLLKVPPGAAIATFAGGCFWCMEPPFDKTPGVLASVSGYTAGRTPNPTYSQVSRGLTGHTEAVRIMYDPKRVSYAQLLEVFWRQIDPTTPDRQFVDEGAQYRSGIYYHDEAQKKLALASKLALERSGRYGGKPIVTEIQAAGPFYAAELYHQDYYLKNPAKYKFYRYRSGRDQYLGKIWKGDPLFESLK
jgi:methionine-S-sulfoxide reductase